MKTSFWATMFWTGGLLAHLCLAFAIFVKARWHKLPLFSTFIAFQIFRTAALLAIRNMNIADVYSLGYGGLAMFDYVLQIGVIAEVGAIVWTVAPHRIPEFRTKPLVWSGLGLLIAVIVTSRVSAPSLRGFDLWDTRASLFTSLVTCQFYLALSSSMNRFGIRRGIHILAVGNGLALWNAVALCRDGILALARWRYQIPLVDNVEMTVYLGVTVYWARALWLEEPVQEQVSEEMFASVHSIVVDQQNSATDLGFNEKAS